MNEVPKRLTPINETIRELYLKSGNECAFPNCTERIINSEGIFIGELCHIEGALPEGERFNINQTNEERRSFPNLMLLCHPHHVTTDNVEIYTVAIMKKMKLDHETKYTNVVKVIHNSLLDYTEKKQVVLANKLDKLNQVLKWGQNQEQLNGTSIDINKLAKVLKEVPRRALEFLVIIINRGYKRDTYSSGQIRVLHDDLMEAMELDDHTVMKFVRILEQHGLVDIENLDHGSEIVLEYGDWPIFSTLKEFCDKSGVILSEIIVKGRFDLLD
jgi:hypothetical protein